MPLHENPIHTPVSLALLGSGTCSKHSNRDSTASISSHSQLSLPCLYKLPSLTLQSSWAWWKVETVNPYNGPALHPSRPGRGTS